MKQKFENLGLPLTNAQSKSLIAGDGGGKDLGDGSGFDNGWKCCWVNTNNCSVCAAYGSCVTGAEIKKC